jgi:RNA polymerase sigma-70 factor (ECF subfamily)
MTPEQFYDQQWAIALLGQIMERLQGEFEAAGKANQFEELKGFVIGDHAGKTYAHAAARMNMTESAAKKAGSRMRQRYRDLLREEIAQTVSGPDEVNDEIRNLFASLKS